MYYRVLALLALALAATASPLAVVPRPHETRALATLRRAAAINFGNCSNPEIQDINGTFSVVNTADFGSVAPSTNLDDVVLGVCNVLATNCVVDGVTNGDCSTAASDTIGVGNTAAADDEFNSVLGITSNFASTVAAAAAAASASSESIITTTLTVVIVTTFDAAELATIPTTSQTVFGSAVTDPPKVSAKVPEPSSSAKTAPKPSSSKASAPKRSPSTAGKGRL